MLQQKINTLIFDEPTNHIDIPTKEVLEDAIEAFEGTLIFVSHDRYFINKFADKTIEFENGHTKTYFGDYDDYKASKKRGSATPKVREDNSFVMWWERMKQHAYYKCKIINTIYNLAILNINN